MIWDWGGGGDQKGKNCQRINFWYNPGGINKDTKRERNMGGKKEMGGGGGGGTRMDRIFISITICYTPCDVHTAHQWE